MRALLATVILALPVASHATATVPDCAAAALRPAVSLQGATGSELGGIGLTNVGASACALRRPVGLVLLDSSGMPLPLDGDVVEPDLGYRVLRLDPGRSSAQLLQLMNACDPTSTAHLWVVLADGAGRVDLGIGAEGRCDAPSAPPSYALGPLDQGWKTPPIPRSHLLHVVSLDAPSTIRAGATFRYTVAIANRSARPLHLARCPVFAEQLWLHKANRVVTRQYVLDCHTFPAHARTVFTMHLRVPPGVHGSALLQWGLEDRVAPIPALTTLDELLDSPIQIAPWSWLPANVTVG